MRAPVVGVVAVALVTAAVLAPVSAGPTPRAEASTSSDPVPLYDRWTATSKLFDNGDGTMTAEVYSSQVQVPDPASDSGWSAVDTTLQPTDQGYSPDQADAQTTFSNGADDSAPVAMANGGGWTAGTGREGNDPADFARAETVSLEEVFEFYDRLGANGWNPLLDQIRLCVVDTTIHGSKYQDMACDDNGDSTVFLDTADFLISHMSP
jgi:hypothetical protein